VWISCCFLGSFRRGYGLATLDEEFDGTLITLQRFGFPIRKIRETTSSAHLIFAMWRGLLHVSTDGEASLAFSHEENSPKEAGRFAAGLA
jgi:hypothetical protein